MKYRSQKDLKGVHYILYAVHSRGYQGPLIVDFACSDPCEMIY